MQIARIFAYNIIKEVICMRTDANETNNPHQILGNAIRKRRQALKISQTTAGLIGGCGRNFVCWAEKGKPSLQLDKLLGLLQALGLSLVLTNGSGTIEVDPDASN